MLILRSLLQTGYSMPAGQSGHCQCIRLVDTAFFQNDTLNGTPYEIRTRVPAVKGRYPGPLDERCKLTMKFLKNVC